ncbi:MAG: helix-turn-helix transcriptional regulator [Phycisphaerales bacterium]|jgi:PadR family transcriptional regulator PadR|nr:helix-turn-helix transcriptional regulator [Phycisphaerales bacterium]
MRIERELMRGAGPVAILKLLSAKERYGYELVSSLESVGDGALAMGQSTLYPMLYNLEGKGFVQSKWKEGESGKQRKYYTLTGDGRNKLAADTQQWKSVTSAMKELGVIARAHKLGVCSCR